MIEEMKEGHNQSVSETNRANKFQGFIFANIKKNENFVPIVTKTWNKKNTTNRGFSGDRATEKAG